MRNANCALGLVDVLTARTEFIVLRTTYGLLDENGQLKPKAKISGCKKSFNKGETRREKIIKKCK